MKHRIIYQDDAVIVVYKPAGLATQTAKVGQADLVSELKKELMRLGKQSAPYLGVIHRLDQPVEGLLVFAKTPGAAAELSKQLTAGSLNKKYFAVLCGQPSVKRAELVDYMIKGKDNLAQIVSPDNCHEEAAKANSRRKNAVGCNTGETDAREAVLQYKILEDISTPAKLALADIHIETGRFHQIRCQMAHAGLPLLGDLKYGTAESLELGRKLGIRNVALCAYKLVFQHPVTKKRMSFEIKPENKAFDSFLENNFGCDCLY